MAILTMFAIDWSAMFVPTTGVLEIVVRGSIMYFAILALLRVTRREAGGIGTADLLVAVLIADAAQNAMAAEYKSITEGAALVATIVFWDYAIDWLSYHVPVLRGLIEPSPITLVRDGKMQIRNMRRELITKEELKAQLREHGIDDVAKVKKCCLEADGNLSVIKADE